MLSGQKCSIAIKFVLGIRIHLLHLKNTRICVSVDNLIGQTLFPFFTTRGLTLDFQTLPEYSSFRFAK